MGESHSTIMSKLYDYGIAVSNTQCLQSLEGIEYLILDAQPWITQGDYTVEKLIFDGRAFDVDGVSPHDLELSETLDNLLVPMCLCNDAVWIEESRVDPQNAYLYVDKKGHPHFEMNWTAMGRGMDSCLLKFVQKFRDVDTIRQEYYPMLTYYFPHEDGQFRIYQALDGHFHEYFTGSIECVLKRCDHCYKDGKVIMLSKDRIQFLINLTRKIQIETGCIIRAFADYRLDECDENYQFSSDCINFPIGFTAEDDDKPLSGYLEVDCNLVYNKLIFIGFVTLTLPRKEDSNPMITIMKCLEKPEIVPIVCTPWNLFYGYNIGKYSGTLTDDTSIDCILYNEENSYAPSHPLYKDPARIKSLVYSLPSNFEDSYWDSVLLYSDIVLTSCTPTYKLKLIKHLRLMGKKIGLLTVSDRDLPLIDCVDVAICVDYASEALKEKCPIHISDYNLTDVTKVLLVAREMNGHKKEYSRFFDEDEQPRNE